jgi:hypothetical protein
LQFGVWNRRALGNPLVRPAQSRQRDLEDLAVIAPLELNLAKLEFKELCLDSELAGRIRPHSKFVRRL